MVKLILVTTLACGKYSTQKEKKGFTSYWRESDKGKGKGWDGNNYEKNI